MPTSAELKLGAPRLTLGYGDILPQTNLTRTLSVLESLVGQIFLTVTIARLVGMQIASRVQSAD